MTSEETLAAICEGLREEIRKRWGRILEIEEALELSPGDLSDFYSGRRPIRVSLLLRILEALEVDITAFFVRTLGAAQRRPEDILAEFAAVGEPDGLLVKIESATRRMEQDEPPTAGGGDHGAKPDLEKLTQLSVRLQQARLRRSSKYRNHAFVAACLKHLDSLRYDDAGAAAKLAATVAIHLVPKLPGPQPERLALQCLALGIFGSARRVKGRYPAAAQAFQIALELSQRHRLAEDRANLLIRASYLLKDFGQFQTALEILREALEIFVDFDSRAGIGRVLVDRGTMLWYLGHFEKAVLVLQQALRHLTGARQPFPRYMFTAYQLLTYAFQELGRNRAADLVLQEATRVPGLEHGFYWAELRWMQGNLAFRRGQLGKAETLLHEALAALASIEKPGQEALVSLDLLDVLLAQDKLNAACDLAKAMARLLDEFETNPLAEEAIVKLVRPALAGKLTRSIVGEIRSTLGQAHAQALVIPRS